MILPLHVRIAELEADIQRLTIQAAACPQTPQERGHQLRRAVNAIVSLLDAQGAYWIVRYRTDIATALCDTLYGNAPVDLPSWPSLEGD